MADIGVLSLGEASVERIGVDVENAGGGVVVEVVTAVTSMFATVAPIDVAVIISVGCERDRCECDTKCGGFVGTAEGIIDVLEIKWKMKMTEDEDKRGTKTREVIVMSIAGW